MSGEAASPQNATRPPVAVYDPVAGLKLPLVETQVVPDVNCWGVLHKSFAGCAIAGNVNAINIVEKKRPLKQDLTNLTGFIEWA